MTGLIATAPAAMGAGLQHLNVGAVIAIVFLVMLFRAVSRVYCTVSSRMGIMRQPSIRSWSLRRPVPAGLTARLAALLVAGTLPADERPMSARLVAASEGTRLTMR